MTQLHLDNWRPLGWGKQRRYKMMWTPALNEDVEGARRNKAAQLLILTRQWCNEETATGKQRGRIHYHHRKCTLLGS